MRLHQEWKKRKMEGRAREGKQEKRREETKESKTSGMRARRLREEGGANPNQPPRGERWRWERPNRSRNNSCRPPRHRFNSSISFWPCLTSREGHIEYMNANVTTNVNDIQAWLSAALTYQNDYNSSLTYVNTTDSINQGMTQYIQSYRSLAMPLLWRMLMAPMVLILSTRGPLLLEEKLARFCISVKGYIIIR
ncbi:hypothetical protein O6H91_12G032500 [Diphasiastrum complanatum]|uniref:Uncharacterized protein n=1 Tax=Diphasiastrum complanatum TaxID=34168 RepID=A0ACC2C071_DIPCM|nr:hypothetical protein O6H91_12G032500 [Diphasiastrum complanatum]